MLSDRSYMRDNDDGRRASVLTWLISAIVAAFVLQNICARWFGLGNVLEQMFGLSPDAVHSWHLWTFLTYGFLHSTGNLLQVLSMVLAIYFIGRELVPLLGARRFLGLYAAALIVGGAFWTLVHWNEGGGLTAGYWAPPVESGLLGSSAAVSALFIVYACFYPDREITFLVFFLLPVTLKPKILALAFVAIDLCTFAFWELLHTHAYSPSAHLGGMAVGWLYFRFVHDAQWRVPSRRGDVELPRWMKRGAKSASTPTSYRVNLGTGRADLKVEVDRILDKINSHGFQSLSAEEKRVLDEARAAMTRR